MWAKISNRFPHQITWTSVVWFSFPELFLFYFLPSSIAFLSFFSGFFLVGRSPCTIHGWMKIRAPHISCSPKFTVIARTTHDLSVEAIEICLRNWIRFTVHMLHVESGKVNTTDSTCATFRFWTQHIFVIEKKNTTLEFSLLLFLWLFSLCRRFQWINWRSWACVPSSVAQCWEVFANGIFWYTILLQTSGGASWTGSETESITKELHWMSHSKLQSWLGRTSGCCWLGECHSVFAKLAIVWSPERTANKHSFLRRISREWPGLLSESICHVVHLQTDAISVAIVRERTTRGINYIIIIRNPFLWLSTACVYTFVPFVFFFSFRSHQLLPNCANTIARAICLSVGLR